MIRLLCLYLLMWIIITSMLFKFGVYKWNTCFASSTCELLSIATLVKIHCVFGSHVECLFLRVSTQASTFATYFDIDWVFIISMIDCSCEVQYKTKVKLVTTSVLFVLKKWLRLERFCFSEGKSTLSHTQVYIRGCFTANGHFCDGKETEKRESTIISELVEQNCYLNLYCEILDYFFVENHLVCIVEPQGPT